ncbi:MAG: SPASM domain-containing protein [Ruminococcus sp.]|jgi:radical SAM protein with 4Fe4S-binding SPASM domain|nr:SPASM domain-containing protein [Ruminococcus sp.]
MAVVSDMYNKNRVDLSEAIPLKTPFIIQLEPSGFCNLKCVFCTVNDPIAEPFLKKDTMTFETFKKFTDDCKLFPEKIKILRIIGNGEPLMNKQIVDFVSYAKQSGTFEKIEITTNATLLSEKLSLDLVNAGLDILKISLEAIDDETFKEVTKVAVETEKLKERIKFFYQNRGNSIVYIKCTDIALKTEEKRQQFLDEYGEISDYIYIENVANIWYDFGEKSEDIKNRYGREGGGDVCVQPFKLLAVCADGTVLPCCADWKRLIPLGNISDKPLTEIWNGENLRNLRLNLLEENAGYPCSECSFQKVSQNDNITEKRAIIAERLKER